MRIGRYELRKPWVKYVNVPTSRRTYLEIKRSILEDMMYEVRKEIRGEE
jgi:hypothetical protein